MTTTNSSSGHSGSSVNRTVVFKEMPNQLRSLNFKFKWQSIEPFFVLIILYNHQSSLSSYPYPPLPQFHITGSHCPAVPCWTENGRETHVVMTTGDTLTRVCDRVRLTTTPCTLSTERDKRAAYVDYWVEISGVLGSIVVWADDRKDGANQVFNYVRSQDKPTAAAP